MSNSFTAKYAKCPFFGHDDKQRIACNEGVEEGNYIHLAFGHTETKREYRTARCDDDYESCPIYQMLCDKYK